MRKTTIILSFLLLLSAADMQTPDFREELLERPELLGAWEVLSNAPEVIRQNISVLESMSKLTQYGLLVNIGRASDHHLANIHRYTANGDYLNAPMREPIANSIETPDIILPEFEYQSYLSIIEGLRKLRLTNRLETGIVMRGRTLSKVDYDRLFGPGSSSEIPVKGFVSATKDRKVAEAFAAGANFPGPKVRMIWKIKSRNGVDIDDISDWGSNLGPIYHADAYPPVIMIQQEVLLEEGYFRKLGAPQPIMENGVQKKDSEGNLWFEVELEELGTPIRKIEN